MNNNEKMDLLRRTITTHCGKCNALASGIVSDCKGQCDECLAAAFREAVKSGNFPLLATTKPNE